MSSMSSAAVDADLAAFLRPHADQHPCERAFAGNARSDSTERAASSGISFQEVNHKRAVETDFNDTALIAFGHCIPAGSLAAAIDGG